MKNMISSLYKTGLLVILSALLSACWTSESRLIDSSNASKIDFEGAYRDTADAADEPITIHSSGPRSYVLTDGDEQITVHYLSLKQDWYLVQYEGEDDEFDTGETFYIYQIMQTVDGQLHMYMPDCENTPDTYAGMKRTDLACNFSDLNALKDAALDYVDGIENGEFREGPEILEPVL